MMKLLILGKGSWKLNKIQGLWIGGELSPMEVLSIKSFLDNGHEYNLYTYGDISNVPEGTTIKDGNEILPESEIFTYQSGFGKGSYSAFSNYFRYKMLLDKGGWWVDSDMVCMRNWDFDEPFVFITEEEHGTGKSVVNSGAIKCDVGSEIMRYCWEFCQKQNKQTLQWGTVGPRLLGNAVDKFKFTPVERQVFCVIAPFNCKMFTVPMDSDIQFPPDIYGLHLWNEAWKHFGINKREKFDDSCIYEKLKKKHGVEIENTISSK